MCEAIAHRALGSAVELEELSKAQDDVDPLFLDLAAGLHELNEKADALGVQLTKATAISRHLQVVLSQALEACIPAAAAVEKHVKSTATLETGTPEASSETWFEYVSWVALQVHTFELFYGIASK